MADVDKAVVKASLAKIQLDVKAMGSLAQHLADRLEKAEAFIRRFGYCPECEKPLPKRGMHQPNACRHKPRED